LSAEFELSFLLSGFFSVDDFSVVEESAPDLAFADDEGGAAAEDFFA